MRFTYIIKSKSGAEVIRFVGQEDDSCIFEYFHKNRTLSVEYNLKYSYNVFLLNEETGKETKYILK